MITIKVRGKTATVHQLQWACDDSRVVTVLNNLFTDVLGADPTPDLTAAALAVERLGGEIISAPTPPTFVKDRIY